MHELSVAESIVAIANAHAAGGRVLRVEVKVGQLRQVVPSALAFAFPIVARGTLVEGAALVMEQVSVVGRCRACGGESEQPALPFRCAGCGGRSLDVVRGEELMVESIEIEQEERQCIASR